MFDPLTRYPCCPPTCGAAAAVLASDDFAKKHGIDRPVYIAAQTMTTDFPSSFEEHSMINKMVGYDMAKAAAAKVYEQAGIGPDDVDVVELHDCFTANELLTYEALSLCKEGQAEELIRDGDNTYGGKFVTNRPVTCSPRATRSARPASRSTQSWCGTCAARPRPARSRARSSPCSTTSASAVRAS